MTGAPESSEPVASSGGTVYLIHFDKPYKHARHYTGWASNLPARLKEHRAGHGARLMQVIKEAGITWHVSRTWPGTRNLERAIKERKEAPKLCPDCTPKPKPGPVSKGKAAPKAPVQTSPQKQLASSWPEILSGESQVVTIPASEPGVEFPTPQPEQPDPSALCRDLWDVTEKLLDGWLAEQRNPESEPELETD